VIAARGRASPGGGRGGHGASKSLETAH
jgi:hypothetical protein